MPYPVQRVQLDVNYVTAACLKRSSDFNISPMHTGQLKQSDRVLFLHKNIAITPFFFIIELNPQLKSGPKGVLLL